MPIFIQGEIEKLIAAQLADGNFQTAEEVLEAMMAVWKASQSSPTRSLKPPIMSEQSDFSKLAAAQGVKACVDPANLRGTGWPAEDSIEEFEAFLRQLRRADVARGLS